MLHILPMEVTGRHQEGGSAAVGNMHTSTFKHYAKAIEFNQLRRKQGHTCTMPEFDGVAWAVTHGGRPGPVYDPANDQSLKPSDDKVTYVVTRKE